MVDIVDKATRSRMMSGIRGRNTQPEKTTRKALFAAGLRYRLHSKGIPGRPDIVLPGRHCVVFVHGCFWHRHPHCRYAYVPKTNKRFWNGKFRENVARDKRVSTQLRREGWRVFTVWECQATPRNLARLVKTIRSIK